MQCNVGPIWTPGRMSGVGKSAMEEFRMDSGFLVDEHKSTAYCVATSRTVVIVRGLKLKQ